MDSSNSGATPPVPVSGDPPSAPDSGEGGALGRGLVPGHAFEAFDWRVVTEDGADLVMEMRITPRVVNNSGALQGGLLATLVDSVAGFCVMQGDVAGRRPTTSEMQISFLAGARVGPVRAAAHVLRRGGRSVVVRVDVRDVGADDLLVAVGTLRFALSGPDGSADAGPGGQAEY
jgi:uncharacterized protein (TIGR00369 family)